MRGELGVDDVVRDHRERRQEERQLQQTTSKFRLFFIQVCSVGRFPPPEHFERLPSLLPHKMQLTEGWGPMGWGGEKHNG